MTNLLTDRLLAAIDLHDYRHGGRSPLQATKDYIAKHGEFDGEVMFTKSNKPQDFYNLLQAMLQSYAYVEFYRRG